MPASKHLSLRNLPADTPYSLRNLRLPQVTVSGLKLPQVGDGLVGVDLVIDRGEIKQFAPANHGETLAHDVDLAQAIVWPCPIDCHTHLDKGQVWPRSPNTDGTFNGAGTQAAEESARPAYLEDLSRRVDFSLRAAYAYGTRAVRSHVDGNRQNFDRSFNQLEALADNWASRLMLQLCPFADIADDRDWLSHLAEHAAQPFSGVLSSFVYDIPDLDAQLDVVMDLANQRGLALDFHADENLSPESHCLRAIARAVKRNRFEGSVLVGHCCALSVQAPDDVARTLDLVAEAGIGIVALPLCNAYLMDRHSGKTPRSRGVAPVHEARSRGIDVALASDNTRDAYYAYGDLDLAELFRDAIRMMQLDHPVGDWPASVTTTAAKFMGYAELGSIRENGPADLVIFESRNWSEFVSRPQSNRTVLRAGRPIDTTPPDFSELDCLGEFSI